MSADQAPPFARPALPSQVTQGRIVAIGRRLDPALVDGVAQALLAAGIGCFEITLNEPEADALGSIALLARRFAGRLLVGAGTVLSIGAAERALDAGATFLVSPHTDEALVAWSARDRIALRAQARARFDADLSFDGIGRQLRHTYEQLRAAI